MGLPAARYPLPVRGCSRSLSSMQSVAHEINGATCSCSN